MNTPPTTTPQSADGPLHGVRVVEVALGVSVVGAGMAASLPGALLRDLGATVVRVQDTQPLTLDAGIEFGRVWDRGKEIVSVDADAASTPATVAALVESADVVFLAGPEEALEARGLGCAELTRGNPRLVAVRIRPSRDARGPLPDLELLLAARTGLLTQIRGNRPGPVFADLQVASAGAALAATVGALAGLYEREDTGRGGWAETSLADGLRAILPMIVGRVEHPSPSTTLLWANQGPAESLAYACADGEYVQLWFGAKGAYEDFLRHMDEPPSEQGYQAELISGAMVERGARWAAKFATKPRSEWLESLAGQTFRCEPVLRPGEALLDRHVRETGLSVEHDDAERGRIRVLGPLAQVVPVPGPDGEARPLASGRLLSGVRVVDLSAFLAGPVTPQILAELGADVIKVEPPTGDVHRSMEPMFAAGQRGKRAIAVDMKAPGAADVLARLFAWGDVVHHNSRVGLAERLGYDEATVHAANPHAVYSHASGFGQTGPYAKLAANDQLMQALSGVEGSQGGPGQPPRFLVWGAIDVTSGWLSACAVLAALYARRRDGAGQSVATSLLGAALLLKSGAHVVGAGSLRSSVVGGPVLDQAQTGYGAAYRIYQGGDGAWFALAVPDAAAWQRLREVVGGDGLPDAPPPLRTTPDEDDPVAEVLEAAFRSDTAAAWAARLAAAGVPSEPVAEVDRSGFIAALLDDPVRRQLGRVVTFDWGERGRTEQPAFAVAFGPEPAPGAPRSIPGLGEHTAEVLEELGVTAEEHARLAEAGVVPAAAPV